jgi:xanthine dehydrogenase accessory factor
VEEWIRDGRRVAVCTVVRVERSAPRLPGSVMAVADTGEVAGSVTGGCVESALYIETEEVLAGGPPRLVAFGIVDDEAFEVGLPCGGTVHVFIEMLDPEVLAGVAAAVRDDRPAAYVTTIAGERLGHARLVEREGEGADEVERAARPLLALGESAIVTVGDEEVFVSSLVPRPAMYIFGAIDFASALATVGRFLGYRVTVCDPRALFITPARFPDADELVTEWPHDFLAHAPVDERTAICVLTHDEKFDVPALLAAFRTPARFIGAMGSRRTTDRRRARLLEEGATEEDLARVHAPIGISIGSRTPEEVAIAIGAQITAVVNRVETPAAT